MAHVSATVSCHHCRSLHPLCQLHKRPHPRLLQHRLSLNRHRARGQVGERSIRSHIPWEVRGWVLCPALGSKSDLAQLAACVRSLQYQGRHVMFFSLKKQSCSSPFKIRIPLLFVSFWNTMRTDWGHDSELSMLPRRLPLHLSFARKKKAAEVKQGPNE
jgi:hypothetical protein